MKADQYLPVILFTILYKVNLTSDSVDEPQSVTIQMKVYIKLLSSQYFHVVPFIFMCKVVVTFDSADGTSAEVWPFK